MKSVYILLGLLVLVSCSTTSSKRIKNIDNEIVACKTTRQELIDKWGEPDSEGTQSGFKTMSYSGAKFVGVFVVDERAIVFLNQGNTVIDYARNPVGTIVEVKNRCK